jgi:hypothetical protein
MIHLICMPLWIIASPIIMFFYGLQKTGQRIYVKLDNGELTSGIYQADGTIRVTLWQGPHPYYKLLNQDGSWVKVLNQDGILEEPRGTWADSWEETKTNYTSI